MKGKSIEDTQTEIPKDIQIMNLQIKALGWEKGEFQNILDLVGGKNFREIKSFLIEKIKWLYGTLYATLCAVKGEREEGTPEVERDMDKRIEKICFYNKILNFTSQMGAE